MSEIASSSNQISIAYYVKVVNDRYGKNQDILESIAKNASDLAPKIKDALFETGIDLAESIQSTMMTKENLKTADEGSPRSTIPVGVDRNARIICPEILGWAIAILAAAWTECVFT
jgi:hypothetical protein